MRNRKHSEFAKTNPSKTSSEALRGKLEFHPGLESAQKLRELLRRNKMSLLQVSKESRELFPGQSLYQHSSQPLLRFARRAIHAQYLSAHRTQPRLRLRSRSFAVCVSASIWTTFRAYNCAFHSRRQYFSTQALYDSDGLFHGSTGKASRLCA